MKKCFCSNCADYTGDRICGSSDVDKVRDRITGVAHCSDVRDESQRQLYNRIERAPKVLDTDYYETREKLRAEMCLCFKQDNQVKTKEVPCQS